MDPSHTTFNSAKFTWIGRVAAGVETITVWHTSPVQSIEQVKTSVATRVATGPSSGSAIFRRVLNNLIATKFEVVTGCAGSKEMLLAMERGEENGCGAIDASTLTSQFSRCLSDFGGVTTDTNPSASPADSGLLSPASRFVRRRLLVFQAAFVA